MADVEVLKFFSGGQFRTSESGRTMDVYDPSIGEVIARASCCTAQEVEQAVDSAAQALMKLSWAASSARPGSFINR